MILYKTNELMCTNRYFIYNVNDCIYKLNDFIYKTNEFMYTNNYFIYKVNDLHIHNEWFYIQN